MLEDKLVTALERVKKMVISSDQRNKQVHSQRNNPLERMIVDKYRSHNSPNNKLNHAKSQDKLKPRKQVPNHSHTQSSTQFKFPNTKNNELSHKTAHNEMLERELALFRREVETKFRNSVTNSTFQFPRKFRIVEELEEEAYSACKYFLYFTLYIYIYIL